MYPLPLFLIRGYIEATLYQPQCPECFSDRLPADTRFVRTALCTRWAVAVLSFRTRSISCARTNFLSATSPTHPPTTCGVALHWSSYLINYQTRFEGIYLKYQTAIETFDLVNCPTRWSLYWIFLLAMLVAVQSSHVSLDGWTGVSLRFALISVELV